VGELGGDEAVAWHLAHGLEHGLVCDAARAYLPLDHLVALFVVRVGVCPLALLLCPNAAQDAVPCGSVPRGRFFGGATGQAQGKEPQDEWHEQKTFG
jgi:hypothetical protein